MNTDIIRGNALQVIELVEKIESLKREETKIYNEKGWLQLSLSTEIDKLKEDVESKAKRISELEKEKEELNKRCERLNADSMAYCNYGKEIEKKKNNEIKELQEEKQKIIEGARKTQEEESFMTQKCIEATKEVARLKSILARNGIKYRKVKNA